MIYNRRIVDIFSFVSYLFVFFLLLLVENSPTDNGINCFSGFGSMSRFSIIARIGFVVFNEKSDGRTFHSGSNGSSSCFCRNTNENGCVSPTIIVT